MNAQEFYSLRVRKAKTFGFPDPIFINAEKLSDKSRVIYLVEIQATHIFNKKTQKTHHYALKFSKFKKIKIEPFWEEENIVSNAGFAIIDRSSVEKLAAYIKANQALLGIDILSKDYTSAILSNDIVTLDIVKKILASEKNKEAIYELFKEQYPELDRKILTYKLVQARRKSLTEFKESLDDENKKERDYLFESEDGFVDIVEIKHPHLYFWQTDSSGCYKKYRNFLQPSEGLKGAIIQGINYIFQVEKKFADPDWQKRNNCETPVKPNCTIIFGRSNNWKIEEKTAFRLLNDSLHGIDIITFDHLFDRASRLLQSLEKET